MRHDRLRVDLGELEDADGLGDPAGVDDVRLEDVRVRELDQIPELPSPVLGGTRPHEYGTEYGPRPEQIQELYLEPVLPVAGRISLPTGPGLGLTLNEAVIDRLRV